MISSPSNPQVKRIKRLRQKKYRIREEAFYIEGLRGVLSAIECDTIIESIYYSSELLTSEIALQAISDQRQKGIHCLEFSSAVFKSISTRERPVGLGAIVKNLWTSTETLDVGPRDVYVALIRVSEPGNLGAIIRSIDGAGVSGLLIVEPSVDPYHPTAVKASMGTIFSVPHCRLADVGELKQWIVEKRLHTIATSAHAIDNFRDADYRYPNVLMLGNEKEGLSKELMEMADLSVAIPMHGTASSLNLATAATVLLYELAYSK
jgi:TrmH family RNA methyltransferase